MRKRLINAFFRYCKLKESQFLYIQLLHKDNMNPFLNLVQKCSSKKFSGSMHFYIGNCKALENKEPEKEKEERIQNQHNEVITEDFIGKHLHVRQYAKDAYYKPQPKAKITHDTNLILISDLMLETQTLINAQLKMLKLQRLQYATCENRNASVTKNYRVREKKQAKKIEELKSQQKYKIKSLKRLAAFQTIKLNSTMTLWLHNIQDEAINLNLMYARKFKPSLKRMQRDKIELNRRLKQIQEKRDDL